MYVYHVLSQYLDTGMTLVVQRAMDTCKIINRAGAVHMCAGPHKRKTMCTHRNTQGCTLMSDDTALGMQLQIPVTHLLGTYVES